ncbi:MAG: RDD family protein [Gammaproteobacteria bacterium]|nr:RDD family protein [Gammaproteobacteria bacterium]NIR81833.1 RDD family protein [Gammaproteobacteria bacterium]NIR88665.1 RDD family protein [Gammaproteobacteria bacterium]NIU02941.1 RDD family protein [Gammaproteobacteria bacterium]NIV50462.1 hypothetical protein [Gammaproteobacteria bacterium]
MSESVSLAGAWRRIGCALIDCTSLMLGLLVLSYALFAVGILASPRDLFALLAGGPAALGALLAVLALAGIACWTWMRGTPGQLLMGCQVVDAHSGRRLSVSCAALRCGGFALALLPAGLGVLWIAWDRRHQGWHDKIAGSLVVLEDESRLSLDELAGVSR